MISSLFVHRQLHVTASHPSPGDNHQSTGGRSCVYQFQYIIIIRYHLRDTQSASITAIKPSLWDRQDTHPLRRLRLQYGTDRTYNQIFMLRICIYSSKRYTNIQMKLDSLSHHSNFASPPLPHSIGPIYTWCLHHPRPP